MKHVNQRFFALLFIHLPLLIALILKPGHASDDNHSGIGSIAHRPGHSHILPDEYAAHFGSDSSPWTYTAQSEYPILEEDGIGEAQKPAQEKQAVEPITRKIPIWGEKIREMGYDLPLPFGAGANFVWMDQGIDIRELTVGVGSRSTEPGFITFSNARSRNTATTVRLDAWLLPFMNIYGLFGYLDGNTELDINVPGLTVDVPIIGPVPIFDPFTIPVDVDYDGVTYGGGVTLAGGYKRMFGSLDMNYTRSDINLTDGEVTTLTISPRLGILFDPPAIKGSGALWIGAMYMDYKETISDSINLKQIDPSLPSLILDYEVKIKNKEKFNFIFGGQWEITKRWQIMAEGGVGERKQLILGAFFRF
jgi:hypothetical protein